MDNVSKEIKTINQNQKEILIKNTVTEMKNAFDRFINTMYMAKESVNLKKCQ